MEKINIPAWLFMLCAVIFDEIMLHIWTPQELQFSRIITVTVCALFFGLIFALLTTIGSSAKLSRILALIFSAVFAVLTLLEFFIQNAFKTFMLLSDIADNAGHVAGGFGDTLVTLITQGLWRILVILLPVILYGFLGHLGKWGKTGSWVTRAAIAVFVFVSFFAGMLCIQNISPDTKKYDDEYTFDGAVRSFGLSEALVLNLLRSGNSHTEFIDVPTTTPTKPPVTEPTEKSEIPSEDRKSVV